MCSFFLNSLDLLQTRSSHQQIIILSGYVNSNTVEIILSKKALPKPHVVRVKQQSSPIRNSKSTHVFSPRSGFPGKFGTRTLGIALSETEAQSARSALITSYVRMSQPV